MPVRWEELGRTRGGDHYDLAAARNRAARLRSDPWEGWEDALDQRLPEA
jgi:bifunctional non-homologous end joining protein LigD